MVRTLCLSLFGLGLLACDAAAQVYLPLSPAVAPVAPAVVPIAPAVPMGVSVYSARRPVLGPPVHPIGPYAAGYAGAATQSTVVANYSAFPTYTSGYGGYDASSTYGPVLVPTTVPVQTYPAGFVRPKYYVPGQPVRNFLQAVTP